MNVYSLAQIMERTVAMATVAEPEPRISGIQIFARTTVIYVAYVIWTFVGVAWLFMLFRVMSVYGWALVHHVFTGRDPPNASQLDYVALFWVKGFAGIGDAFSRDKAPGG